MRACVRGGCAFLSVLALMAPSASATTWFGFDDKSVTGAQISATQSASLAAQAGADSSTVTVDWSWVQPTPAAPNFSTFDAIYNADLSHGIRPLFILTGSPPWAWTPGVSCPAGATCHYPPGTNHDSDWQSIAADLARRYPLLAGIEIWNEPNQSWAWWGGFSPARYTQLLRLAYTAIKAVNASIPVIGGALATDMSPTTTSTSMPLQLFLQGMYSNGARGYMNGIGIHPYPQSIDWWYEYKALSVASEVRNANGDSVPLWITETGMSTTAGFTTTDQAIVLSNLIPPLLAYPGIAGVYVNTLVEPTDVPATDPERGYGVLYPTLKPKPAYCEIAELFGTGFHCPALVAEPRASQTQILRWQAENLLQAAANGALAWHKVHGTYQGLTNGALHSVDPRVSASPLAEANPGAGADPSQIGIWFRGPDGVLLCNASRGDRSYCIYTQSRGTWVYGKATGSVYQAAHAVLYGISNTW